jgi:hypothetical protein
MDARHSGALRLFKHVVNWGGGVGGLSLPARRRLRFARIREAGLRVRAIGDGPQQKTSDSVPVAANQTTS